MGSISLIFAALAAAATSPRQSHRELKLTSRVDHAPPEESLSYWRYVVDDGLENPEALAAADLDGDGQPEIMVGSEPDVTVHRVGAGGATGTWVRSVAATATEPGEDLTFDNVFTTLCPADLDGDGDVDFVAGGLENVILAWYENADGAGETWRARVILADIDEGTWEISVGDVDGDGDLDVLTASRWSRATMVAWYENDGNATGWTDRVVSDRFPTRGATGAATADVDGDNVNDVVVAAVDDQYIVWFHVDDIRTDRELWSYEPIVEGVQVPVDTWAGDFDGDGDVDVVCATTGDGKVTWYENLGTSMGDASWATHHIATDARSVKEIFVGDVDDDGQPDVLSANFEDGAVVWYQTFVVDGTRTWTAGAVVDDVPGAIAVVGADVDGDGDLDLVAVDRASLSNAEAADSATDTVTWYDMHLVPFPTASPTITFKPTDAPLPLPTPRPTALPTPVDPLRPTHARTLVPTCLPTQATLPPTPFDFYKHFLKRYREQLAIAALAVVAAFAIRAFVLAIKPCVLRIEPYYMPAITAAHKEWLKSDVRKFLCYCCPECCRGRPPEDPLNPRDGVKLAGDYEIPVRVVYDEPRGRGKIELIHTGTREITFFQKGEYYSCYS